jgi:amino acid transporter
MATSAPAAVVGLTLASLAAAGTGAYYGGGMSLLICAIPMVIIAYAYHRLNTWNANSGASFEWVGRSINPYLGWFTGWLMIVGYVLGTLSGLEVLGPNVLAVFGATPTNAWSNVGIVTGVGLAMIVIAVVGIKLTARVQVGMAALEYAILIGISIWGLVYVLGHHHGTVPVSSGWLNPTGIGGKGNLVAGFVIAIFAFSGWDGTVYVNEEVKRRRYNPGRAAILAVILLTVIYVLAQVGLQGVVSSADLQNPQHAADAPTYVAGVLGGSGWAKVMALAVALSGIATTGTGIVVGARIIYGMAGYRALPGFLANVPRRFATPALASIVFGLVTVALGWVYLLRTSIEGAFNYVVYLSSVLFAMFYILTAAACVVYYRRRVVSGVWNALSLGVLPAVSAVFLGWMGVRYVQEAAIPERWSLLGIVVAGVLLMLGARFGLKSPFFGIQREAATAKDDAAPAAS